jgi:hypothetical protein
MFLRVNNKSKLNSSDYQEIRLQDINDIAREANVLKQIVNGKIYRDPTKYNNLYFWNYSNSRNG